jgi:cell division protein FtsA
MPVKPIYGVGLDAGSRGTRVIVCALEGGRMRLLGYGAAPGQGWLKGRIADQGAAAESIAMAAREAERLAGVALEDAVVGMGGPAVRGANTRGVLELGYIRGIEQRDVNKVVHRASHVQLQEDRMLLQLFLQDFVVDEHPGHRDPRNMKASRLEVNAHLLTTSVQEHEVLVGAVNQAHIAVEETVFEALAACYSAVLPEERREGIAVVDIGAHSTDLAAYYGDAMYLGSTVRVCGDHFTRDLAQALRLSYDQAEQIKLEYGSAASQDCPESTIVELPTANGRECREARRKLVAQVLEARSEELFGYVRSELERVGMENALLGGVFLTGGGARMPDLCDVAERVLQCETRFGLAVGIRDWVDELNDPEWSVVAGLAMYSAKLKTQTARQKQSRGWLGKVLN